MSEPGGTRDECGNTDTTNETSPMTTVWYHRRRTPLEIMDVDDLAAYLKVKPSSVYERLRWRAAGEPHPMPAHKMGGYWRFLKHEIDAWLVSLPATPRTRKRKYTCKQVAS